MPVLFLVEFWPFSHFGVFTKQDHPDNLEIFTLTYNNDQKLKDSPGRLQNISDRLSNLKKHQDLAGAKAFLPEETQSFKVWKHSYKQEKWQKELVYQWKN